MSELPSSFVVSELYSNEEIYKSLCVGNAGGVRAKTNQTGEVDRLVILTSIPTARQLIENPYHDRLEGDILIYTGAGKAGDQAVSGANVRIVQQQQQAFPIYGFTQIASRRDKAAGNKRWRFLGLLEYMRCYQERQVDSQGEWRNVWIFELRVHGDPMTVKRDQDRQVAKEQLERHRDALPMEDREVVSSIADETTTDQLDVSQLEIVRRKMLAYEPREFEHVIKDLLVQSGFENVEVTRYSQDGGVDVNARPGARSWPIKNLLIQLQAKRWLHTVGRKEVAELRGSLLPHAAGCIVTTSHFSRAAIGESNESGKIPIRLIDGHELANTVKMLKLNLP